MGNLIKEILLFLSTIPELKHLKIYNSQLDYLEKGGEYAFSFPAVFIELQTDSFEQLPNEYQNIDIVYKFHIVQDYYNSDLNLEQNLSIFDLRDILVKKLSFFKPTKGGIIVKSVEQQDFNHSNVYHYILEYKGHFIDDAAVKAINQINLAPASYINLTEQIIIKH